MTSSVDEFENAFQSCVTALTNSTTNYPHDPEEVKTTADQTVQRFLDSAKAMECFFLQKRLYLSVHKPDQLMKEDIDEIKIEIQRKDNVISKFQEKLQMWQRMLSDQPQAATPITQMPSAGHPLAPHPGLQQHLQQGMQSPAVGQMGMRAPHPGQQMMSQMVAGPPQQMVPQQPQQQQALQQQVLPPQGQMPMQQVPQQQPPQVPHGHMMPSHAMSPGVRMQGQGPPPHVMAGGVRGQMMQQPNYGSNPVPRQPHFMPPNQMLSQQQPQQPVPQVMPQQPHPQAQQAQQSPLAFLERTTSNIGLPDSRR